MTIWHREVYEDDDERKVTLLTASDPEVPFKFVVDLVVQVQPGVNVQQRVELKARTVEEAFAELPAAEREAKRLVAERIEAAKKRVVSAREVPAMPNGLRLNR